MGSKKAGSENRERQVGETFVELVDTLASDYEIGEFLQFLTHRCTEILQADTAGVLLETPRGHLELAGAASDEMYEIEQIEIELGQGPCIEAYRSREPVIAPELATFESRWPQVVPRLAGLGMQAGYAFPLQFRGDCIGALNLYRTVPGEFRKEDVRLGQAFAHMAAIGILQERKVTAAEERAAQLQHALDSRLIIEQAKGVLAQRHGLAPDEAFEKLRHHARRHNSRLHDLSRRIVHDGFDIPMSS